MKKLFFLLWLVTILSFNISCHTGNENQKKIKVRGWTLLSDDVDKGIMAIDAAKEYGINHLQLSHHLIHDLKDLKEPGRLPKIRKLIAEAQEKGIEDILVWDHALYDLNYYPDEFKNKDGLITLDNPEFWKWFKADYRSMLDSLKGINGIILTFIETGAHVEDQYSDVWKTEAEKLANLVDSVASVVIDERGFDLYIRTFIYTKQELESLLGCVNLIKHPKVKVMTKEVPHDFFLTHPVSTFIEKFDKESLIEFDLGHEFNGQGVIASILPEITMKRWKYYATNKNVIGYVARTDRYHNTQNIGRPTEINLYALKRIAEDTSLTAETIVEEFITKKYGKELVPHLKDVFLETDDIITSVLYTLGLNAANHSSFDLDYSSNYSRHCSGKWLDPPIATIKHDVNKSFHYWKEVIEILSPARYKAKEEKPGKPSKLYTEVPWVIDSGWVTPTEKMNMEYLGYIIKEKEFGLNKATWALNKITEAKDLFASTKDYEELLYMYERTQLTAELYLNASKAYFGYRCYLNKKNNEELNSIIKDGLAGMKATCEKIKSYPNTEPHGQYTWIKDVEKVEKLYRNITEGWNEYGNVKFIIK